MLRMTCFLGLLLTGCLWAKTSPADTPEKAAIERAKSVLVSSLDRSLPKVTLEYFLKYESQGAAIHWEVNDCGERSGNPDRGRDFSICVEADFDVDHRAVSVMVGVGTINKGVTGTPELFSATVSNIDGPVHAIKQLGSLPAELYRPLPRSPQDLPPPAGTI